MFYVNCESRVSQHLFLFFIEIGHYGCRHPFQSHVLRMSTSVSYILIGFPALRMSTSTWDPLTLFTTIKEN